MINFFKRNELYAIIFSVNCLLGLGMGLISPILPQYARTFGVNITMIGLLITVFGVARLVTDIPAGRLADRFGRRFIIISGPVFTTIGSLGCGLAPDYWTLLCFRFVQGAGSATFVTASMIMLADIVSSENRGQIMSWFQGSFNLGISLGPAIGGFTAQYLGLRAPFFFFAGLAALASIWTYLRIPEIRSRARAENLPEINVTAALLKPNSMLTQLFKDRNFVLISLVSFVVFFTRNGTLVQILPLLVSDRLGASAGGIGVSLTILSTFNFIALLLCGKLSDRFGRKALILPGVILTAVAIVMLSLTQSYWFLILTCVIWGIGSGSAAPVPAAYVVDILPRENYSGGMSLYRTVCDLGFVIGPVLIGWLADIKGFNFPLLFNASFLLLAVLLFQVFAKEPSRYKGPEAVGSK